ncbi:MAG TPA: GNAT family N-acetyltransferase [Solirubrobacteraceae bacterium]|nr:GNAT family N-acetyltransferase [Solirubrobacteraceae bacterium]
MEESLVPRSLVWATSIDVLPPERVVSRRDGYLAVRSPTNPTHYWGNLLIFDDAPGPGDGERWEEVFAAEFADAVRVRHRTFAWDRTDDARGAMDSEFRTRGYDADLSVGMIATPDELHPHPRANADVVVKALDPEPGADDERHWEQVLEVQAAGRDPDSKETEEAHRVFSRARQAELRMMFRAGLGAWYVALDGDVVAGSMGIVVTGGRARYQAVDTAISHRRRGICSRLLVDAARHTVATYGATRLVIVADPDYHAAGIYESVGFTPVERVCGVCRPPAHQVG